MKDIFSIKSFRVIKNATFFNETLSLMSHRWQLGQAQVIQKVLHLVEDRCGRKSDDGNARNAHARPVGMIMLLVEMCNELRLVADDPRAVGTEALEVNFLTFFDEGEAADDAEDARLAFLEPFVQHRERRKVESDQVQLRFYNWLWFWKSWKAGVRFIVQNLSCERC